MLPEPRRRTRSALGRASWQRTRRAVLARDGWECQYCGQPATIADHFIPADLWRGAHDDPDNLKAACASCNNLSLTNKQRKFAERHPSTARHERDGAAWRPYAYAYHRHPGPIGTVLTGHMGMPLPEDAGCPPGCSEGAPSPHELFVCRATMGLREQFRTA